jgi:hypothetical protein
VRPMHSEKIEETDQVLSSGAEWHSTPIRLHPGQRIKLTVVGKRPVYADLLSSTEYVSRRNKSGTVTRFKFGSDQAAVSKEVTPKSNEDYYLVVRNGMFTPRQQVHVRLVVEGEPVLVSGRGSRD